MDNQQLNIVLSDIRAIIDCLNQIAEKEGRQLALLVNPKSFMADVYATNISLVKECKECLEFIVESLPKLQPDYKEVKVLGYNPREFQSKLDLQKYRKEMKKVRDCIDFYAWKSHLVLRMTNSDINTALIDECSKRLTQANSALYKIK